MILIGDIDQEVAHSFISSFADDTRIGNGIQTNEDASQLQQDLDKVYQWATRNNMTFNDTKFDLIRYGQNTQLKEATAYNSNANTNIEAKSSTKDLGVTMSATAEFTEHIAGIVETVKDLTAWILRSFKSRSRYVMLFLWKTIVIPRLDYCSQLWNPSKAYLITQLEELQKHFVRRIHGFQDMEYNEALHELNLLSLQRRRERYQIIYLWCIIEDIYPNLQNEQDDVLIKLQSSIQSRRGRTIATKVLPNTRYGNLRFQSLPFAGARLFNALPQAIRNITGCSKIAFKSSLARFLKTVKDNPLPVSLNNPVQGTTNNSLAVVIQRCEESILGVHRQ